MFFYKKMSVIIRVVFHKHKKKGKLLISHRSTAYPCYLPILGEFSRSWSYKTYPMQKYNLFFNWQLFFAII